VKRVVLLVEGYTEIRFVKDVLAPYLSIDILLKPISSGGSIKYDKFRKELLNLLYDRKNYDTVTTMQDLYKIGKDFPCYDEAQLIRNPYQKVDFLEKALTEDISRDNFIPNLQLHEFETLLFCDKIGFHNHYSKHAELKEIDNIITRYPNPELINEHYETAPSRRIAKIFGERGYKKYLDGILIARQIGIEVMLEKCTHFRTWVEKLKEY